MNKLHWCKIFLRITFESKVTRTKHLSVGGQHKVNRILHKIWKYEKHGILHGIIVQVLRATANI